MKANPVSPEIVKEIVKRLQSFAYGSLTIKKHRDRVVGFEKNERETVDERGRVVPG